MALLKEITTQDEWQSHVGSLPKTTLLVILFHAPWAGPCAQMSAVLAALAEDYAKKPSEVPTSWVTVNAEELSDVSETYDVVAVPYVVLQKNDQVLESVSGSDAAKVRRTIEKHAPPPTDVSSNPVAATTTNNNVNSTQPDSSDVNGTGNGEAAVSEEQELRTKLEGLVSAAPVMLFMKGTPSAPQCGFSRQMVAILRERSVKYGFFNILADDDVRQGLKKFADWPTYPQLWVAGELVGGLDIVKEELDSDPDFFKTYSVPKENGAAAA
ncbi:glutaredoxin [Hypoxylon crocopeplum]|nr:glutaredoxin [Hypoxylon crocopeplum]